ncbi:protein MutL [Seminavis robusta]|uniref:Protein MutL n=1 Tax=Seminavis robusta TaxID=568900 RepID=A0A9N8H9G4_9STRA|nr:protein MutL [Seminavis robusta]|eukprot:Sro190_g081970.1 protein MutL (1070) ;mRNA; r:76623-80199
MADSSQGKADDGMIRPIEEESVRRIVAGQAVSDLASAVKELLDNALDAGSKSINIRLFNQGLEILEVSDDGTGVPPVSRPFLAQAHATSKIRAFDDIYSSATSLGFRGEALFCLANLSGKLIVATRTESEPLGQKMEFKHDGTLDAASVAVVPRKVGTTVAVVKLLNSLPVRRADMERRITQHRSKLMRLMEAYAIFSVGVRINLMDVIDRKETTLLGTTANSKKLEDTISSILGSKFLASVAPVTIDLASAVDESSPKGSWKLEGFLSKAASDQDGNNVKAGQQFFCINGRPVELPKVARTIGDVWRSMGSKKKYSCILTLTLPNQEYDVNLSPEKRQVLLTHEDAICEAIQTGVTSFWASQTDGKFTPAASQPSKASAPAPAPASDNPHKKVIPKIDNMESLAKIQESNRQRARELHAQIPNAPSKRQENEQNHDMDVDEDDNEGEDEDEDGQTAAKREYMRRFKREQNEQRRLNASGAADLYEDDKKAKASMPQEPTGNGESPRVRRRGGFVHDISTAKQWERPSSLDRNFQIPEGIEDPSDDEEETKKEGPPEKRRRTGPPSPVPAKKEKDVGPTDACSSRRVTLSLNNEVAASAAAGSVPVGASDGDKLRWVDAQSRFNKGDENNPEKEIDVLLKSSVSPKQAYQTPHVAPGRSRRTNNAPALNLEQFAFGKEPSKTATQPAVSPEEASGEASGSARQDSRKASKRRKTDPETKSEELKSPESDLVAQQSERSPGASAVVWESFGTENVVKMARLERRSGLERKRRLQEARRDQKNDDGKETSKVSLAQGDFAKMRILGQFNLGFILASDEQNHLWILDQHACDERANFERLMQTTVMHHQQLIAPMPLELDPSEETCILDNMEIFEKNGFRFQYNEDKPPRHRMSLTALPHSGARDGRKAVNFGKEDVSALCVMLGAGSGAVFEDEAINYADGSAGGGTGADGSGMYGNNAVRRYAGSQLTSTQDGADKVITRLPKAIAMFASRACRSSVMVGTALSKKEMEKLVKHLDELDDPWKCAHGRPTLTHLVDLKEDLIKDQRKAAELISAPTLGMNLSQEDDDKNP